jgi:hypothetical protein
MEIHQRFQIIALAQHDEAAIHPDHTILPPGAELFVDALARVALTPTLQREFRGSRPFSAERKLCTLTLIVQHIRRKFDPYLRQSC